ncbi:L-2-amino-thiazoline-4-carboxylic acid hydrolase [Brenneria populi subsp. brevivirga]|uniref:L-2-amino-thiazoline-4-carboxylic acid hydrolase n=1 Tax=Brenneria populi TaxID=1505588 RepID=UPI002E1957E8|nr:L-2-amino-thiazoline-4-carboxylic acid hydrolase [Brenneria populi subsp. brevivirga]
MMSDKLLGEIKKNNTPSINDEVTLALRGVTEKRASTIANMIDEAKSKGLDDGFARAAIYNYGAANGRDMAQSMKNPNDIIEFSKTFTSGLEPNVYEMELIKATEEEFQVHFHYCPYVNKWLQQNRSTDELANLCDICMEGDSALATAFANLEFELGNTIAKGGQVCEIHYRRSSVS